MNTGKTIFSQVMEFLPLHEFRKCVRRYQGDYKAKNFSCLDQFLCMSFAQLTHRESLRDIQICLRSMQRKLYHMGIRGKISRSTLADANENRDWRIYADFAQVLIHTARDLYCNDDFGLDLANTVYALDATTIDLCLSVFPWAKFRKTKAGIKLHTVLDLCGNIPTFIEITNALLHDANILDILAAEPGVCYIMDRGYIDFFRLYRWKLSGVFFVVRSRKKLKFRRVYFRKVDKSTGLRCDQTIVLTNSCKDYPEQLRRVCFFDVETSNRITLLTNDFSLPALTITQLYKCRRQVELFFLDKRNSINLTRATQDFLLHLRKTPDNEQMDFLIKTFMRIVFKAIHIQNQEIVTFELNEPRQTCYDEGLKMDSRFRGNDKVDNGNDSVEKWNNKTKTLQIAAIFSAIPTENSACYWRLTAAR